MTRPDLDTLRLLRQIIDDIATSPAIAKDGPLFAVSINLIPDQTWSAEEPGRRDLRDLLDRMRQLDMRTNDVWLERVYPILRTHSAPDWIVGLDAASADYGRAQLLDPMYRIQHEDDPPVRDGEDREPRWILPPEAFRLWAYGGVIHDDYAKEQRWARLDPLRQGLIRNMAYEYAMMLLRQAAFLSGLLGAGLTVQLDE